MFSYKARYVKNRNNFLKDGSVAVKSSWETPDYSERYEDHEDYIDTTPREQQSNKTFSKRGKLITFYKNGDPHFKGVPLSVSQKQFVTFETLLDFLNTKITTRTGVKHIFSWPECKSITDVKQFQTGSEYVASDSPKLNKNINYGDVKPKVWHNKKPSAVKYRHSEQELLQNTRDPLPMSPNMKPRILSIISNTNRTSREKVMLNPSTNQTFEEILEDIGNMVVMQNPPVTGIFTARRPHKKVFSFSQLFKDFRDHDTFLAVGRELAPTQARKAPLTTQSDSDLNSKPAVTRKPAKRVAKQYESDYDEPPTRAYNSVSPPPYVTPRSHATSSQEVSLFSRVAPPRNIKKAFKPPVSPKLYSKKIRGGQKSERNFETVRIQVHSQRRGLLGPSREFYTPSNYQPGDGKKPDKRLQLDWVYGYRGRDARNNLYILPSGELLYYVSSIAVLYDKHKDRQRHYLGHNEDITSMVLHPNDFCVATGQASGSKRADTQAHIRIWDARSLATYAIIGLGEFNVAVGSIAFSVESDGQYLLAVDESEKHTLSMWAWQEEKLVVKTSLINDPDFRLFGTTGDTVVWGVFHPFDDRIIITYGKQHIYFWKIFYDGSNPTRLLRDKLSGVFVDEIPKFVTSVCFNEDGDVISGDSNGNITMWKQDDSGAFTISKYNSKNLRAAHNKSVFCLMMDDEGLLISGGGHEIKKWDSRKSFRQIDAKKIPDSAGFLRTFYMDENSGQIVLGTTKNSILEGSFNDKFKYLIQGHSEELWALSVHPEEHSFVTAGYDHQVIKWSAVSHKIIWSTTVDKPCLSVCQNHNGKVICVGTAEGRFIILDGRTGSHLSTIQVGTGAVDSTKFSPDKKKLPKNKKTINSLSVSPDGRLLAMGAQDGNIYLYDVIDGGQYFKRHRDGILRGHKNFVMQLDWSVDSEYIQSVSGDYDLIFWDVTEMRREKNPGIVRDLVWQTQTCILGYSTVAPWSHLEREEEDVNVVCKSNYEDYLVTGDNQGGIKIFKYPASTHQADYYERKSYSSHVTDMEFIFDDSYLITTGGIDAGLLQWALAETATPR